MRPQDYENPDSGAEPDEQTRTGGEFHEFIATPPRLPPSMISRREALASYPRDARLRGQEGRVAARCDVDPQGHATCVVVNEHPIGYGFGRAAQALLLELQFEPQTIAGIAVDGQILVAVAFSMESEPRIEVSQL